jgi:hypothetical protein
LNALKLTGLLLLETDIPILRISQLLRVDSFYQTRLQTFSGGVASIDALSFIALDLGNLDLLIIESVAFF